MDILKSMGVMIGEPALALIPAALFLACFAATRGKLSIAACALWIAYCLYEFGMKYRVLCSGECNIRIDLFVIYPALILVSLAALVVVIVGIFNAAQRGSHHDS